MSQERTEQVFEESSDRGKEGQIEIRVTRDTWTCNDCGFEMNAEHYNADSPEGCWEYDCPVCENEELESEIDRLNAVIRDKDDAIDEWKEWYETALKKIDDLTAKVQERDEAAEYWRIEAFKQHPTQEAYDIVCKLLESKNKELKQLQGE